MNDTDTARKLRQALTALLQAAEALRDTPEHSGDELSDEAIAALDSADVHIRAARIVLQETAK